MMKWIDVKDKWPEDGQRIFFKYSYMDKEGNGKFNLTTYKDHPSGRIKTGCERCSLVETYIEYVSHWIPEESYSKNIGLS